MSGYETLAERYATGRITTVMLKIYVKKGVISAAEYEQITGEPYQA